jgi:dihydrofolate reductase
MEARMKKLITTHWVSLDGYVDGPGGSMDWLRVDEEMMAYEQAMVADADTLMLGRGTYGDFAGYWPGVARNEAADPNERRYAQRLDRMRKVVVSRTLQSAAWPETDVLGELTAESVGRLKAGEGTIVVYGSVKVVRELVRLRMVDEVHLLVHPLTVGSGTLLFDMRVELELVRVQPFASGATLGVYRLG